MARVYTKNPGDAVRIGNYGEAMNDTPAEVPESVAAELEAGMAGEPVDATKVGHVGRAAHDRFRIERSDAPPVDALESYEAAERIAMGSQEEDEAPRKRGRKE